MVELNPFEIFGLKCNFNIDRMQLITQFAKLQQECHPDAPNSSYDKALNITYSFEILKDDIKRGEAILKIYGIEMNDVPIEQEFLIQLIESEDEEAQELYEKQKEILQTFQEINENNVAFFAVEFLKYKYLQSKLF